MRFAKGSIEVNSGQDMQLLRQVVHSKFVTHDQLFEFMTLGAYENKQDRHSTGAFGDWWSTDFLERHYVPEISKKYVYRIGDRSTVLQRICNTSADEIPEARCRSEHVHTFHRTEPDSSESGSGVGVAEDVGI